MDIRLPRGSRILLVEPPFFRLFGYTRWHFALTLSVVGSYLREQGYEVIVYDADRPTPDCRSLTRTEVRENYHRYKEALADENHPVWAEVMQVIAEYQPDGIGLTATSAQSPSADMVARKAKEQYGDRSKIFLGGSHVDGMSYHDANHLFPDCYDFIVPKNPNTFASLFNRKPERQLIAGLDRYTPDNLASMLTSVGCPNRCTFCYHSVDRCFVYRDAENLQDELEEVLSTVSGVSKIMLLDHCLFSNARHFSKIMGLLKKTGLPFSAGSRVMALSPAKLQMFLDAGGNRLNVGIESGSQGILDAIEKRVSIDQIVERTRWINESGVPWMAYVMVGFPFETVDDLKRTEDLLNRIRPSFVSINRFTPYPGTVIYEQLFRNARFELADLFQLDGTGCTPVAAGTQDYIDYLFRTYDTYNKFQPE